jgi:hypothetical protein
MKVFYSSYSELIGDYFQSLMRGVSNLMRRDYDFRARKPSKLEQIEQAERDRAIELRKKQLGNRKP